MTRFTADDITTLFLALGTLLLVARVLGELSRAFGLPSVLGEMLAGVLLGPTVLGAFAPGLMHALFPLQGPVPVVLQGITTLSIALFLLVAGMEVELSTIWRQGKQAFAVGIASVVVPLILGAIASIWVREFFPTALGPNVVGKPLVFALFFGTAMAVTALPVIAKILLDLDLFRSDLGMVIIAAAILCDLACWVLFSMVLSLSGSGDSHGLPIWATIVATLLYTGLMLTVGRVLIHRALPFVQAHMSWPGGVLGTAISLALFGAAFTEYIGVHAIFGAFIFGIALGDSHHLRFRTRTTMDQFISFIFAPLFFASIGLRLDFLADMNLLLTLVVLVVGYAGKLGGTLIAARAFGLPRREAWAVALGMSTHGAMDIILGLLALESGLIGKELFVAIVVSALATASLAGPLIQRALRRKRAKPFTDYVGARSFIAQMKSSNRFDAIRELVHVAGARGASIEAITAAVIDRENIVPTGVGNELALPHARIEGLAEPQVAIGISIDGIDFDASDGQQAQIIALILTPKDDTSTHLELYRQIITTFRDRNLKERVLNVKNYTELLAALATAGKAAPHGHDEDVSKSTRVVPKTNGSQRNQPVSS